MKKAITIILCLVAMLALGTLAASAVNPEQKLGYWIIDSAKADEVLAEEAGEATIGWEVPYLHLAPTIDGQVDRNEYVPFELYEDYLAWMAPVGDANSGTTEEEFLDFYNSTQQNFFDAYWGWDGTYLYMAFDIRCVNGFSCTPDKMGGDVYLFAYNCLQVGIADVDARGKDSSYVELGFGVQSEDGPVHKAGDSITFNWSGTYCPTAGVDYIGVYDAENQMLTYECRIHLQSALGLSDRTVQNGDEMNFAWLLAVNGEATTTNETWQIGFCHGIGGPYSAKQTEYFARVTFEGMPEGTDVPVVDIAGVSEEDKEYGLIEFIDMSQENVVNTFTGENAAIDFITENGESFARITSLSNDDTPYVYSSTYPKNLLAVWSPYVVIKYRTSSQEALDLGFIYRTQSMTEYNLDGCYTEELGCDGEWHTVLLYMTDDATWVHYIINMGFVPFYTSTASAGETLDIAFVKCYQEDPYELYVDSMYEESDESDSSEASGDEDTVGSDSVGVTEPDVVTEEATVVDGTSADTNAPDDPTAPEGCTSLMGAGTGLVALLAVGAALVLRKKKED